MLKTKYTFICDLCEASEDKDFDSAPQGWCYAQLRAGRNKGDWGWTAGHLVCAKCNPGHGQGLFRSLWKKTLGAAVARKATDV